MSKKKVHEKVPERTEVAGSRPITVRTRTLSRDHFKKSRLLNSYIMDKRIDHQEQFIEAAGLGDASKVASMIEMVDEFTITEALIVASENKRISNVETLVKSGAKLVRHPFFPLVTKLVPVLSSDVNVRISNVGCFWQERPYCSYGSLALE